MKRAPTEADILMWDQLEELNTIGMFKEYKFHDKRRWKFDFAILNNSGKDLAIEIEGGAFTQGRHTRGAGFVKDMEKYNHATLLGWRVLRFTPQQVLDGSAIAFIRRVLES